MRAPRALFGPGYLVCSWAAVFLLVVCCPDRSPAAARPAREIRSTRRLVVRPVPPPPTGMAAGPSGALRTGGVFGADVARAADLEVRTGPAAAHGHSSLAPSIAQDSHPVVTSHIPEPTANFACNSPESILRFELWALELQRFQTLLKLHPIELHASFLRGGRIGAYWWRSWIPQARCAVVWKRRRLCLLVPVWG